MAQVDEVFSVGVGQHVVASGIHHRHSCWELLAQHLGDPLPVGAHLLWCMNDEHGLHGRRHYVLARYSFGEGLAYGDVGLQVAHFG